MDTERDRILRLLTDHRQEIPQQFRVRQLGVFGSVARNESGPESDVDVLVEFQGPPTYDAYFGLRDYLGGLLGRPIDLVTDTGLKARARRNVERDLVRVA